MPTSTVIVPELQRRILVVDDEPLQRLIFSRMLLATGLAVDCAANLAEARNCLGQARYDALVLDLSLRDEDSLVLLRHLTEIGQMPVIVFVSGMDNRVRAASSRMAQTLGLTVAGTLSKPVRADELRTLLDTLPNPHIKDEQPLAEEPDADELAADLAQNKLTVHYQPQVSLADCRIVGAEALARWPSARYGAVSPGVFIPIAERAGLIGRLTDMVLTHALRTCVQLRRSIPGFTVSVNVSPISLSEADLPSQIEEQLRIHGLPPGALIIELTEGCAIADGVRAAESLTRLRIRGIGLAIDDFGTGHSSLLSLLRLPFCELKIDQSFVRDLPHDAEAEKITRATVALSRELGLRTVAEGIETQECADLLRRIGCDIGQGWLFGRPVEAALLQQAAAGGHQRAAKQIT